MQVPLTGPTPIQPNKLALWLQGYDTSEYQYLLEGFTKGFMIGFDQNQTFEGKEYNNLLSAIQQPTIVQLKIDKEVNLGKVKGPSTTQPFTPFHCSPLGIVEKKEPGEYRVIHHLSHPEGKSNNNGIPQEESFVQYSSVNDAISFIKRQIYKQHKNDNFTPNRVSVSRLQIAGPVLL